MAFKRIKKPAGFCLPRCLSKRLSATPREAGNGGLKQQRPPLLFFNIQLLDFAGQGVAAVTQQQSRFVFAAMRMIQGRLN